MSVNRCLFALLCAAGAAGLARAQTPPPDLANYVAKADKAFAWKLAGKTESDTATMYDLDLTSQVWHEITWTHKIQVFVPKGAQVRPTMVLWNQGGRPNTLSAILGSQIAQKVGAPVAFLYGIPNQPLFNGKKEDALIAETFVRFLQTKDASWPLLFPMVKSLVKAMDALQAFAHDELKADVKNFVVTGASKRGWTSWLTAASGDKRVKAIAPLVIDTLNFPAQMKNQVAAFGKPSEMVRDYTTRGLIPIPDTAAGKKLWVMVDPWVYRDKITVPKMIINGANDPYWPLDALNSYWDDLKGDKFLLYVPNAGHDLRERDAKGSPELLPMRAVNTLSAFCRAQIFDKPMPKLSGKYTEKPDGAELEVAFEGTFKSQRLWVADSPTRDFRKANWSEKVLSEAKGKTRVQVSGPVTLTLTVARPQEGFRAAWLETEFEVDGVLFPLSTQIRILEAKK